MTNPPKDDLRTRLLAERATLTQALQEHREPQNPPDDPARDAADRGDLEAGRSLDHRLTLDNAHLIGKIDLALRRLEEGTYGSCEICGAEIPPDRLLAKPSVSTCLSCQETKEQKSHAILSH
ncbi:MAG: TraR/DksA family transcriptional regulator [Verrucomicrobia bacterium]|nr:TraR/DksA family transcriptional regulator [Verrucomicrobiota bacterium]